MFRVVYGNPNQTPDVQEFIHLLNNPFSPARELFKSKADLIVTRAPGRLDVMGGIADYSGSLVLEFPLAEATFAAVQLNAERTLNIVTMLDEELRHSSFTMPLSVFDGPVEYEATREFFQRDASSRWGAYVAGVFLVLMRERKVSFPSGANILISSRVPLGKGVSSSAALEVAVMQAVAQAFDVSIEGRDKALLCQKVENLVVGAPCGVMDQMTAVFGERDRLLLLLCQPAELKRMITVPRQLKLWGIDSGIRHSVSGADYGSVRAGAFMGLRIINDVRAQAEVPAIEYLANLSPAEFESEYVDQLPEHMSGEAFLSRYKATMDPVTAIDPQKEYAIRTPAAHPIYENARVQRFVDLQLRQLGALPRSRLAGDDDDLMVADRGQQVVPASRDRQLLGVGDAVIARQRLRGVSAEFEPGIWRVTCGLIRRQAWRRREYRSIPALGSCVNMRRVEFCHDPSGPSSVARTIAVTAGRALGCWRSAQPSDRAGVQLPRGGESPRTHGTATWAALEDGDRRAGGRPALRFARVWRPPRRPSTRSPPRSSSSRVESYLGVRSLLTEYRAQGHVELRPVDITDTAAVCRGRRGADVVWVETPTNPTLDVADLAAIARGAASSGRGSSSTRRSRRRCCNGRSSTARRSCIHSGTKFIGGHSDLMIGLCVTHDADLTIVSSRRAPSRARRPARSRPSWRSAACARCRCGWQAMQRNAADLVERLRDHPRCRAKCAIRVRARWCRSSWAAVPPPRTPSAPAFASSCPQPASAVSRPPSSGARSTPVMPTSIPVLLRMSVGIEDVDDLWADLSAAINDGSTGVRP